MVEELCERETERERERARLLRDGERESEATALVYTVFSGKRMMRGDDDSPEPEYYMYIYWCSAPSLPLESVNYPRSSLISTNWLTTLRVQTVLNLND